MLWVFPNRQSCILATERPEIPVFFGFSSSKKLQETQKNVAQDSFEDDFTPLLSSFGRFRIRGEGMPCAAFKGR